MGADLFWLVAGLIACIGACALHPLGHERRARAAAALEALETTWAAGLLVVQRAVGGKGARHGG